MTGSLPEESAQPPSEYQHDASEGGAVPVTSADLVRLLEGAVDATVEAGSKQDSVLQKQLLAIVRSTASESFSELVTERLVSVITSQMKILSDEEQQELNRAVADTLFNDHSCRIRMERLWQSLRTVSQ